MTAKRRFVTVVLFVAGAAAAIAVSILTTGQFALTWFEIKWAGFVLLAAGMLVLVSAKLANRALRGSISPALDHIVTNGPYRVLRHPMYLGFLIALLGVALITRSYLGIISVLVFYLPAAALRAHLEELALATKFGDSWREYTQRTWFIIPWLW